VGEKAHESEGGGPQELDDRADAFEGLQDLLGLPRGDALAGPQCLAGDREVLACRAGSGDAVGLRVLVDLTAQGQFDLRGDRYEPDWRRSGCDRIAIAV
jgi:hypothetical protein